jgi:hypothetical protein
VLGATVTEENARRLFSVFDKGTCGGSSEEGGSREGAKGRDERKSKEFEGGIRNGEGRRG